MSSVVSIMAGLSILISCLGLFGLVAISVKKKTKEIGIRKVLGASETQITALLSRNFAVLILISFVLASPLTYYLLSNWLEGFAYRIGINPLLFFVGGFIAMAIALITISYHTVRSARANPVDSLRYE
jgi:putative ABC transport system permease protein